jgi:hypothetical protein
VYISRRSSQRWPSSARSCSGGWRTTSRANSVVHPGCVAAARSRPRSRQRRSPVAVGRLDPATPASGPSPLGISPAPARRRELLPDDRTVGTSDVPASAPITCRRPRRAAAAPRRAPGRRRPSPPGRPGDRPIAPAPRAPLVHRAGPPRGLKPPRIDVAHQRWCQRVSSDDARYGHDGHRNHIVIAGR